MQPKHVLGIKGDECQCGRRASIRHCLVCGSTRTYARMNRLHQMLDGSVKRVDNEYRCSSCGHLFIEEEREWCEAPPTNAALALQKIQALRDAKSRGEYLNPTDEKIAGSVAAIMSPTQEDPKKAFSLLVHHLRIEYVDRKAGGEEMKQTMDEHVATRLTELNVKDPSTLSQPEALQQKHVLDETLAMPKDETEAVKDAIPIEERSIRLEWGRKKLAGRVVPDIEDYVRRRLAGELFE